VRWIGLAVLFALSIASAPLTAEAQPPSREIPRVGVLRAGAPDLFVESFRQGLRELGWVGGRNIVVELRFAGDQRRSAAHPTDGGAIRLGRLDQVPAFAQTFADLISQ